MIFRLVLIMSVLFSSLVEAQGCHITPGWEAMQSGEIMLEQAGEISPLTIRIANNVSKRAAGYQWICEKNANNTAILFIFSSMIPSAFHMRNVYLPLDIYFFNEAGEQVDAMVMRPEPPGQNITPRYYRPAGSFRYALEIAQPKTHDLESTPVPRRLIIDSL